MLGRASRGAPVRLEAGDVFVVPHGDAYMMGSAPDLRSNLPRHAAMEFFRLMASASAPLTVTEGGGGPERAACDLRIPRL